MEGLSGFFLQETTNRPTVARKYLLEHGPPVLRFTAICATLIGAIFGLFMVVSPISIFSF